MGKTEPKFPSSKDGNGEEEIDHYERQYRLQAYALRD
jgi:hypothetical protein